jgi:hypothetical protein
MDGLESHFRKAKLACVVTPEPIEPGFRDAPVAVVQMDITRAKRHESFRIYRGAPNNRVLVTNFDPRERQLVLMVHEPQRAFTMTLSRRQPVPPRARVVFEDRQKIVIEQLTNDRKRHFLCGMDECHLFIAQLPHPASTVAGAHRVLRPAGLRDERRRQGEWFFVEPAASDLVNIEHVQPMSRHNVGIAEASGLARAGRPHIADEVIVVLGHTFVRGAIRHPDHRTIRFHHWTRAVPNTEAFEQPEGVRWVD